MTASGTRRWDDDERGTGIGGGHWIAADLGRLAATLGKPDWVAEEPEHHLLPHLQRLSQAPGSPWALRSAELVGEVFVLSLDWSREDASMRRLRADAYALLGEIAESVSFIHQRVEADTVHYDAVTGMLPTDTPFRPHGHLVELRAGGADVRALCAGTRRAPGDTR